MKKRTIALFATAVVLVASLLSNKAQALQLGYNIGYSSVGFQLHGFSGEFLFGIGGKDEHRPKGSVIHFGLAAMSGERETNLGTATWNGGSLEDLVVARTVAKQPNFLSFPPDVQEREAGTTRREIATEINEKYGISNLNSVTGDNTAYVISAGYEWVFSQSWPGLGLLAGVELYILNPAPSSLRTKTDVSGGAVLGIGYYMRNGVNFSFKTGIGAIDIGEINLQIDDASIHYNTETEFYITPTFSLGFIY